MDADKVVLSRDEAASLMFLAARCIEHDSGRRVFKGVPIPAAPSYVTGQALTAIQRCRELLTPLTGGAR